MLAVPVGLAVLAVTAALIVLAVLAVLAVTAALIVLALLAVLAELVVLAALAVLAVIAVLAVLAVLAAVAVVAVPAALIVLSVLAVLAVLPEIYLESTKENSLYKLILKVSLVRRPRSGRRTSETLQRIRRESAYAVVSVARCAKRRARAWRSRASRSLAIQVTGSAERCCTLQSASL